MPSSLGNGAYGNLSVKDAPGAKFEGAAQKRVMQRSGSTSSTTSAVQKQCTKGSTGSSRSQERARGAKKGKTGDNG